jgi:hypothetical protein
MTDSDDDGSLGALRRGMEASPEGCPERERRARKPSRWLLEAEMGSPDALGEGEEEEEEEEGLYGGHGGEDMEGYGSEGMEDGYGGYDQEVRGRQVWGGCVPGLVGSGVWEGCRGVACVVEQGQGGGGGGLQAA